MTWSPRLIKLPAMREDLIEYFSQVLGINSVLMPEVPEAPEVTLTRNILVLFVDDKPWNPETSDLFQKMWRAMKLTAEQVEVLFLQPASGPISKAELQLKALSATAVVNFSFESLADLPTDLQFRTVSPSRLIENPALKKEVWSELQKVMLALAPPID